MSLRDFFSRARRLAERSTSPVLDSAIICAGDSTLLSIGTYSPALLFVNESMMDTFYIPDISFTPDVRRIKTSSPREYPDWSWDTATRKFKRTGPAIVTEEMRERAALATKKAEAVFRIMQRINRMRRKVSSGLSFQEMIYAEKEREAASLKEIDFDERRAVAIPYVAQYAEESGLPLRQAAEEILLQAELDRDHLLRTERVRLAAFKKIPSAKTPEELEEVVASMN